MPTALGALSGQMVLVPVVMGLIVGFLVAWWVKRRA
jgi:hypothetical protein